MAGESDIAIKRSPAKRRSPIYRRCNSDRLVAGFLYYDARGDDARVALTLAKTAGLDYQATVANYVRALSVSATDGRVDQVHCRDELTQEEFTVATRTIVNAIGCVGRRHLYDDRARGLASHHAG